MPFRNLFIDNGSMGYVAC